MGRHKFLKFVAAAFAVFYLVTNPVGAANSVKSMTRQAQRAGDSLVQFSNQLGK
jgi:small neutral amino acid transporter SnatA (MarC family)